MKLYENLNANSVIIDFCIIVVIYSHILVVELIEVMEKYQFSCPLTRV